MLKAACVFDREELKSFFEEAGKSYEIDNFSMFYGLYENSKLAVLFKMRQSNDACEIEKGIALSGTDEAYVEFCLKSAINFALTFKAKRVECDKAYARYLEPMGFKLLGGIYTADIDKIDFPSNCKNH